MLGTSKVAKIALTREGTLGTRVVRSETSAKMTRVTVLRRAL